jgi:hypothetical protein
MVALRCGTVDGHRNFPDEPRWYGTGPGYGDDERNLTGGEEHRYADDAFRRPEPRTNRDPRYDGLTDTHERGYGTPFDSAGSRYGEPAAGSLDAHSNPYEPSRRQHDTQHDTGTSGFETIRPYGDPTATAERARPFEASMPTVGPRSGEPLPPLGHPAAPSTVPQPPPGMAPPPESHRMQAEPIDRAALRRGPAPAAPVGDGVYRTRRPLLMVLLAVAVTVLEVPAIRLLTWGAFGEQVSAPGVIGGTLLVIGLPLFALGVHALVTGAAHAPSPPGPSGPSGPAGWLRPPLMYLLLGAALLVAAALAAT